MTIASDIISGIIAGSTGALTAVISVHLQNRSRRRFAHHLKHKENFETLKGAIIKASSDVYPYIAIGRKENPFIGEDYEVNYKSWEVYSILNYADIIGNLDGKPIKIRQLDRLLYVDIKNHWPKFDEKFSKWNQKVNEIGIKSNEIMKVIFEFIRKRITESEVKTICASDSDILGINVLDDSSKNLLPARECELAIYNFVMDTKPDEWPQLHSIIENAGITDRFKKLAEDVKSKKKEELKDFFERVSPFLNDASDLVKEIDKLIHDEKIPHHCEYI